VEAIARPAVSTAFGSFARSVASHCLPCTTCAGSSRMARPEQRWGTARGRQGEVSSILAADPRRTAQEALAALGRRRGAPPDD